MTIPLAVTTAAKLTPTLEHIAREMSALLNGPYVPRMGRSLPNIFEASEACRLLVAGADHLRLYDGASGAEYFYHPNMFLSRGSVILAGGSDHFLSAVDLSPGETLLDCTLGFASESALASLALGETGKVVGLESEPVLAEITRRGLQTFVLRSAPLTAALRRIEVITADNHLYLEFCETNAFDVVYFDPFFDERLSGSEASISPLFVFGNPTPLSPDAVEDARRVARRRVVIKHPGHIELPGPIPQWVTKTYGGRKSRVVYSVLENLNEEITTRI